MERGISVRRPTSDPMRSLAAFRWGGFLVAGAGVRVQNLHNGGRVDRSPMETMDRPQLASVPDITLPPVPRSVLMKGVILGFTACLLSACYVHPDPRPPSLPYGYGYNPPIRGDRADWPDRFGRSAPAYREPESEIDEPPAGSQASDSDDAMRSADDEEVIGGDEPPVDRSTRRVNRPLPVERHRDHSGDYRP